MQVAQTYTSITYRAPTHGQIASIMLSALKQVADDMDLVSMPQRMLLDDHACPTSSDEIELLPSELALEAPGEDFGTFWARLQEGS